MKVERIDHIGIMVKDLEKAAKFFSDLFETEFTEPFETPIGDIRETIDTLGLDLCEPLTLDGEASRLIERRGEGVWAVALKVPNLEDAIAEMQSRGVRLLRRAKQGGAEFATFHPKDTFGVMFELIEYKPTHPVFSANIGKIDMRPVTD